MSNIWDGLSATMFPFGALPTVFPATQSQELSFIELLYKCLNQLQSNVSDINNMSTAITLLESFMNEQLSSYSQEVQSQTTDIMQGYITDGTISNLINQSIFNQINANISSLQSSVVTINDEIKELNYKEPTLNITIQPSQLVYNVGESINSVIINFDVQIGTDNLVKAELYKNNTLIETSANVINGNNTFIDANVINSNTSYKVLLYDDKNCIESNTIEIDFIYDYYYGVINTTDIVNSSLIESLSFAKLEKQNLTEDFTCINQKIVFAYPQSYGGLIDILFEEINNISAFSLQNVTLNNIVYDVYVLNNAITDIVELTFNINRNNLIITETNQSNNVDGGLF